ncbi:MAG: glycine--tRNA ligase [Candidatus Shikimatogenerans sp. Tcar]|uniref:Glycine--tRNA ligase n=1 Tax=Candidatus Shikimatogenerans sp. Tcar TaxID=3158565 RepID=A0AAU7QS94_9FLAO
MINLIRYIKEYGFIFKSSSIYNGIKSIYDYGPYGVLLKNNIKKLWWKSMLFLNKNLYPIDTAIFTHKNIWINSKHKKKFVYYVIINKINKKKYNILNFLKNKISLKKYNNLLKIYKKNDIYSLKKIFKKFNFNKKYKLKKINFMYKINKNIYLRPEISQGVYINYINLLKIYNYKLPFGIIQIGKSFRNEFLSNKFIFRMNEFEQMEIEYFDFFINEKINYKLWIKKRLKWYNKIGIINIKLKKNINLPHYALNSIDIEYKFKYLNKYKEIEGLHLRHNDLLNHKNKLFKDKNFKNISIIESSLGLDRFFYLLIDNFLYYVKSNNKYRFLLKLPYYLSPIKCAIFPLFNNNKIIKLAKKIYLYIKLSYMCIYDNKHSIGKRYKKQDIIGTPYCITVDKLSLIDKKVTIRFRNTMKQKRIFVKKIFIYLKKTKIKNFLNKIMY